MDSKETSLYNIYLITIAVIIGLALYYIISAIRFRTRFRRVFDARLEAEINQLELEKKRIVQDLHDEISPVLTAIKMKLETVSFKNDKDVQNIEICGQHLASLTNRIRNISVALMPSVLQDKGLAIAVDQYIHNLHNPSALRIEYAYDVLPAIAQNRALHMFRIVQEIIHNTIKHAGADRLEISITADHEHIIIASADDGQGFVYDAHSVSEKGYGLSNIQNRVGSLNGVLNINSKPSEGTRFYLELPVT